MGLADRGAAFVAWSTHEQPTDDQRAQAAPGTRDDRRPRRSRRRSLRRPVPRRRRTHRDAATSARRDAQHAPHVVAVAVERVAPPRRRAAFVFVLVVRRREEPLLDVFRAADERDFVFTVSTTLTAAPSATEDHQTSRAVVLAGGLEPRRDHHHAQPAATSWAHPWGIELSAARAVAPLGATTTPATELVGHRQDLR